MSIKRKNLAIIIAFVMVASFNSAYALENSDIKSVVSDNKEGISIKANKSTLESAQEAINNKDFQTAVTYLTGYIGAKPKKYEAYKLRGDAYYELRRYSNAQKDYQTAIDLKASDDKLMTSTKYISAVVLGADKNEQLQNVELGNLYARLMYAQKAQNDPAYATSYENAIKYNSHIYLPQPKKSDIALINCPQKYGKPLNPQGIDAEIYGAVSDIEKEDFNSSIFKIQKVVGQYPNYYLGHYLYAVALAGLEKDDEAISEFNKSISLNPYDFESYASLGQIYFSKAETSFSVEDSKKSVEYFKNALELNPNCYLYYFYIGLNELQSGNINTAITNFNEALRLNPSDYNSLYYQLIAQYNNGDYESVVKGTTSLLYKHVSNYNSVLYLRALAHKQLGNYEKAFSDLESIQNNINDIYNADIKIVTDRDKVLESYIYYLKSEMAHEHGFGAAADRQTALQNPVIAQLDKVVNAIRPYEKSLSGETISIDEYKKFESFYNSSLPKLLDNGVVLTESDVENQYDYIRTTFSDLGLSFKYLNPDYKLSVIENYPYKKYASKLNVDDLASVSESVSKELKEENTQKPVLILPEQTPQTAMLEDESKTSLARMLASNGLPSMVSASEFAKPTPNTLLEENNQTLEAEFKPEIPDAENIETSSNIAAGEPFIYIDKPSPLVNKENSQNVKQIIEEEKSEEKFPLEIKNNGDKELIKISSKEQDNVFVESPAVLERVEERQNEPEKPIVNEKFADVNPVDFGVEEKTIPELNSNDEVIELIKEDITNNVKEDENKEEISIIPEDKSVLLPEEENLRSEENLKKEELPIAVAIAEVPEIVAPEVKEVAQEITPSIRPREIIQIEETLSDEVPASIQERNALQIDQNSESVFEQSLSKAERKAAKQELKRQQKELKQEQKAKEAQEKFDALVQKEQEKIHKEMEVKKAKAQAQAQKEQLKQEREQAKAELRAKQMVEKVQIMTQKTQPKFISLVEKQKSELEKSQQKLEKAANALLLKEEREQAKAELRAKQSEEKAQIMAQKVQAKTQALIEKEMSKQERAQQKLEKAANARLLKEEREQTKAEIRAKQAEEKAQITAKKAQAKAQKEQLENEKKVNNIKSKEKFSIKNFFSKFKKKETNESTHKTVIKSLSQ